MSGQVEECRVDYSDPEDGTELEGFICVPKYKILLAQIY
jgi:hypothetical protein